jgi:hypothetical protein
MGLTWAVVWAVAGLLIGVASILVPGPWFDWFVEVFDAPLPALAVPGFVCGGLFSGVLGIAGRRRRFDELSMPWFSALGAVGGLVLNLLPLSLILSGVPSADLPGLWMFMGLVVVLSGGSAAGTLALARMGEGGRSLGSGVDVDEVGLTDEETRTLLREGS